MSARIAWPDDELLDQAIRAKGTPAVAREIGVGQASLHAYAQRRGIATKQDARQIAPDALKRLAEMVA